MAPAFSAARGSAEPSPWFAVNLSLLFPGLGQLHLGETARGLLWFLSAIALLLIIFWAYLLPSGSVQAGAGALGIGVMLWGLNLVDAHACALGRHRRRFESFSLSQDIRRSGTGATLKTENPKTDLWFALFLSQLLPGLGQLLWGQWGRGVALLLLSLLCATTLAQQLGWSLGLPVLAGLACVLLLAEPPSAAGLPPNWQRRGLILALLVVLSRSLLFSTVPAIRQVVEPFSVPSESMFPTLTSGDRILVYKSRRYQPQLGDIVVFRDPTKQSVGLQAIKKQAIKKRDEEPRLFVKRIVGGPGDRISVSQGQTRRNGTPLDEPYTREPPRYRWESGEIPPRHFVVLGDNRNESFDSSQWGLLPRSSIVGRVYRISWPPERSRQF